MDADEQLTWIASVQRRAEQAYSQAAEQAERAQWIRVEARTQRQRLERQRPSIDRDPAADAERLALMEP